MKYIFEFNEYSSAPVIENAFGILGDLGRNSKFGEQTEYFKNLVLAAQELGIDAYVFTNFSPTGVTAWQLDGDQWIEAERGLPKVFYDRSFRSKTAGSKASNTRTLMKHGCTPINSADFRKVALDKHLMYENLLNEDMGGMGLPYTEKYSKSGLVPFLRNHSSCIIKPRFGSGGKGIIKVSKVDDGYSVKYKDYSFNCSEDELVKRIDETREKMNTHNRMYIIQECIDLPTYNNGVFDVRVIYQRGKTGQPLRTGMAARLAAPNKVTANLHQGGDRETLSRVLNSIYGQDIHGPIAELIRKYSKYVFETLDSKCGPIGEIGIDFLIDKGGKVHLIEVNSIPGRNLFHILPEIRETSIRRPVEYAKHLLSNSNKKSR
jgi:glutathione synthase/RimK-type ligase-like ATP-grasp enzyme